MLQVYIKGLVTEHEDGIRVPLSSAVIVYLVNYCHVATCPFHVCFVKDTHSDETTVVISMASLQKMSYTFITMSDVPEAVSNCVFPVIQDAGEHMIRCGLCCTARHIIKVSHEMAIKQDDTLIDLLGFRAGSLKACSEVSGWTKLCEIELPMTIARLIAIFRDDPLPESLEIPEDLMKLELHFDNPPPLHNDDKKKRILLKTAISEFEDQNTNCDKSSEGFDIVKDFFGMRETVLPHGNMYFRVQSKVEKDEKKFVNSENGDTCKYGCTENKLIKWCAKCNDREKLRRKEEKQLKNNSRLVEKNSDGNGVNTSENGECTEQSNGEPVTKTDVGNDSVTGVENVDDLTDFVKSLTLNDILYEHVYAEGICFTVADIMLFVYVYYMMESMKFKATKLLERLPNLKKWLIHVITLPRMQQTSSLCGFNMATMKSCVSGACTSVDTLPVDFTIPTVTLNVQQGNPEIGRSAKAKHRALKHEITRVLGKIKAEQISPTVGRHPYGEKVQLDWSTVPLAASPKIELPEKRVARKCEQLENLATAVQAVAKPGDVIVDFCSGAGHLGIIIAYLLPDCQVYLIENKEESLIRARNRVLQLQLDNVVLYQCNLDYFQGDFDIGVCLHACGVATDLVLQQCLDKKASFVICPCCYGNIQNTHLISYPRSQYYRERQMDDKDLIVLGHAADQTEENIEQFNRGRECMNLVDTDRAKLAIEDGYTVTLCSLQPLSCTPKNNLLVGTR